MLKVLLKRLTLDVLLVSLNRLSVGCLTTPRRQSGISAGVAVHVSASWWLCREMARTRARWKL